MLYTVRALSKHSSKHSPKHPPPLPRLNTVRQHRIYLSFDLLEKYIQLFNINSNININNINNNINNNFEKRKEKNFLLEQFLQF